MLLTDVGSYIDICTHFKLSIKRYINIYDIIN